MWVWACIEAYCYTHTLTHTHTHTHTHTQELDAVAGLGLLVNDMARTAELDASDAVDRSVTYADVC